MNLTLAVKKWAGLTGARKKDEKMIKTFQKVLKKKIKKEMGILGKIWKKTSECFSESKFSASL